MNFGTRVAVMSDVHGEHRLLGEALSRCRQAGAEGVVLLGDLFDRVDQAEACARQFACWQVAGVLGNHERDALTHDSLNTHACHDHTRRVLRALDRKFVLDDALFVHDEMDWKSELSARPRIVHGDVRVVFAGHTHYRAARDERGPLDISLGSIRLRADRKYLINPGAVVEGHFAIWDRSTETITFERV